MNPSDEELLRSAPADAPDALGEFYRRHERVVLAFFIRRVRDTELAADLAATTFVQVVESRHRFKGSEPGDATAWLFGIAGHLLSRHWRREGAESRRMKRLLHELPALTHAQAAEIDRLNEDAPLMEALEQLPEPQRDAVRAYVLGDRTYDEIAEEAQIGPAAARKRVSRGLAALRASRREGR